MNNSGRGVLKMGLLSVQSVMPLAAQIDNAELYDLVTVLRG
jgi:hypothetical protein